MKRQFLFTMSVVLAIAVTFSGATSALALSPTQRRSINHPRPAVATITLTNCNASDLIAAINSANVDPVPDIIELMAGCSGVTAYTLTAVDNGSLGSLTGFNGLPAITTTITINGHGSTLQRDGSAPRFRIFRINSGGTLTLNDVTITGGYTSDGMVWPNPSEPGWGGAILNQGTLNINRSMIIGNRTGKGGQISGFGNTYGVGGGLGGGILNHYGTVNIVDSTISGNITGDGGNSPNFGPGGGGGSGGGISSYGTLTLVNSTVGGNITGSGGNGTGLWYGGPGGAGGGIANMGTMTVINSIISGNTSGRSGVSGSSGVGAGGRGGGIANGGTLYVSSSHITGNVTGDGGYGGRGGIGGDGGGIYNSGPIRLVDSTISNNITGKGGDGSGDVLVGATSGSGGRGGGIFNNKLSDIGAVILDRITISGNQTGSGGNIPGGGVGGDGAGIYIAVGTMNVSNSTLSGNLTGSGFGAGAGGSGSGIFVGGGQYVGNPTVNIINTTIADNDTALGGAGGGIHVSAFGTLTATNSTVTSNQAVSGGGIRNDGGLSILKNTLIASNTAGSGANCSGVITDGGGNLDDGMSCNLSAATSHSNANASLDPLGLQDNGGSTRTIALLPGSDALDMAVDVSCPSTDQRGVARPFGPHCDIGAYELENQPPNADAGEPYSVNEGASITVTASGSDPEGGPLSYAWDLDNDGSFETPGQSVTFSAAALDGPNSQTIKVQVTDNGGLTATDQGTVEILNVAPTAIFTSMLPKIIVGQSVTLSFNDPFDPSEDDAAVGFYYSYDCTNDSAFELENVLDTSYTICSYSTAGTFTALGRIADKDKGFTDYTVSVIVLTPREGIDDLIYQVGTLIPDTLTGGQGNALIAKLEAAIQQLKRGNVVTAINQLESFINQVSAMMSSGVLLPAEGQPLIDAANAILTALGS